MKKYIIGLLATFIAIGSVALAQGYTFSRDLTLGSSGSDVAALQSWLIANGFNIPSISSGASPKGYFGIQTQMALQAYQRSVGLPAYGFFGYMTRDRINGGGNAYTANSLSIVSPNGGEIWQKGTTQYIRWSISPGLANQTADIRLEFPTPACAQPGQPIRCMIMVRAPYLIAKGVNLGSGSYPWNVGSVRDLSGANDTIAADGQYKIQICPTNGSQCFDSATTFTITSGTINGGGNAPVVSNISGPTSLQVGQVGTWTINASDPQNGVLSYSVNWGDSTYPVPAGTASPAASFVQTTTFTHSYASAGTYTVTFTIQNARGYSTTQTMTVQVGGTNNGAGPLQITFPNGGESWQRGTTQTIRWTSPYYFAAATADLKLVPTQAPCPPGYACALVMPAPYTIATGVNINQNYYNWIVGQVQNSSSIPDGQYTIQICQSGTSVCDSSNASFTIYSGSNGGNQSSITVLSPNGGETWTANTIQQIRWYATSGTYTANSLVDIYLGQLIYPPCAANPYGVTTNCTPQFQTQYTLDRNVSSNSAYNWIVGTDISNNQIPAGSYVIEVCPAGSITGCDTSNSSFTMASAAISSNVPDINIVSPNGGGNWQNGTYQTVSVNITGDPTKVGNLVSTYLVDQYNHQIALQTYANLANPSMTPGIKTYTVYVPTSVPSGMLYKLFVELYTPVLGALGPQLQAYDYSDGYFSIVNNPSYCPAGYVCTPSAQ